MKWRNLDYSKATWEPTASLDKAVMAAYQRRMKLKVGEVARPGKAFALPMKKPPAYIAAVGQLKDYQLDGKPV